MPHNENATDPIGVGRAATPAPKPSVASSSLLDPASLCEVARMSTRGTLTVGDLPPFLADKLGELDRRTDQGLLARCRHVRRGALPHFLPWDPARVRCQACAAEALARLAGSVEDARCDCCGEPQDRLSLCTVLARGLAVTFGVCDLCRITQVPA